jgi:hypothetical protein
MATYASSFGARGVVEPDHLKVVPVSGLTVGVAPGAVLVAGGESGTSRWQTYVAGVDATDGDATVTIPGPSSSGRERHVVVTVPDPERAGVSAPADPLTAVYAELQVLTGAQWAALTVPHYRLATINIPGSASVITEGMVTDQREVALPRTQRDLRTHRVNTGDEDLLSTAASGGETWPDIGPYEVRCPEWATQVNVIATFAQVACPNAFGGHVWTRLRTLNGVEEIETQVTRVESDVTSPSRQTWVATGSKAVPAGMRGEVVYIATKGRIDAGTSAADQPRLRSGSGVVVDVQFVEEAE